ncbi:MAG TPA: hypothetical protein VN222_02735 [Novosphingobium sp.]|nr:hypothetical protein [Novosphingobium sp.]
MELLRVGALPEGALAAAADFHARILPSILASRGQDLIIVFPPADHTHRGWRRAVVQDLARMAAPLRVNAVASQDEAAIAAACLWLAGAPGVTGQLLQLDSQGAGKVIP